MPFLWVLVDWLNELLFSVRFGRRIRCIDSICQRYSGDDFIYCPVGKDDICGLVDFFSRQSESSFEFFKPHGFDRKSLGRLVANKSFIMLIAKDGDEVLGYAFMRSFFNGKSFRGKMVDINHRGQGIAKVFGQLTTDIAMEAGLCLFGTISRANMASMASSRSSNEVKVIEELPGDYLLIQYLPKSSVN